jgi:Ricin-type beta-trefoil lectin domain/Glycosyl hydrolases family 18
MQLQRLSRASLALTLSLATGCIGGMVDGEDGVRGTDAVRSGATYQLVRKGSGKCLDVNGAGTADGTNIQQWTCNGTPAQAFRVDDVGGGKVRLVNPHANKCVDINGAGTANGTNVQLWTCNGTGAQSFVIEDMGDGTSRLRNPNSGKCVDVNGAGAADGTNVQLWTCNTTDAQRWRFNDLSGGGGGGGGTGGGGTGATEYAPYFYTWGWGDHSYQFASLSEMKQKGGPSAATIAFVLSGGGCRASRDIQNNLGDVKSYVAAGGHVKASFGGASGTYLEYGCSDAGSLAAAIGAFVDETGITDLDFDIEQGTKSSNSTINQMRAAALKQVQQQKGIRVAFTLPVNPDGLDNLGLNIVKAAVAAGVKISFVNVMTMDYGDGTNVGQAALTSVDGTARQLQSIIPGLTLDQAYGMVGATAMIGHNDDSEVFSLDNARTLIAFAKQKHLGLVSFWAIQRDEKCPGGIDLNYCSGVNSGTFQFHQIFNGVNN